MERQLLRPAHSYRKFREDCGFTMEDWASFHERIQNALLQPRNYVALQKPYVHREAWEGWLQSFMETGVVEAYWSAKISRKWNVVENGEVIRAFVRDVVITLASEISRARNRLAREVNYVKNIEPPKPPPLSHADDPEPNTFRNIKVEALSEALGTAGKRPHPSSAIKAEKLEVASSIVNYAAPIMAFPPSSSSVPLATMPSPLPNKPLVRLRPVREVVDIEKYDPDAPIELIPEGYVKQFVIDDNGGKHNRIVLLKDPTYNSYHPKKRQATERLQTPTQLPSDGVIQNWAAQITSPPLTPTTPTPWGSRAQGCQAEIPVGSPRLTIYSPSPEDTPVLGEAKYQVVANGDDSASRGQIGIKNEIWSDSDDEYDEDYRGDDEDEAGYGGGGGVGTDTEGEREFSRGTSRRNIKRHRYHLRTTRLNAL